MMKNNVSAKRLSLYFAIVLIVFSAIIGTIFMILFRNQATELQKEHLLRQSVAVSELIGSYDMVTQGHHGMGMMGGYSSYLNSVSNIVGADTWIVDENYEVFTANEGCFGRMRNHMTASPVLPKKSEQIVDQIFSGETIVSETFSELWQDPTVTVGVPAYSDNGELVAAVLIHSPITGTSTGVKQGVVILLVSLFIGLVFSLLLSLWFSKSFTGPILLKEAEDIIRLEKNRKDFLANVAHELKTPITVVKSSLENLSTKENLTQDEIHESNQQALAEISYLQKLVIELLDLTKLQNPDFSMEIAEVNLPDLINDVVRSSRRLSAEKNIQIEPLDIPNISIKGDYLRLRQMLMIILDNAIKFSSPSSKVEISYSKDKLAISDSGIGFSPKDKENIFERFYKSEENNFEGTGLGLPIAKEIANRHDIKINVQSEANKGTCFEFNLEKIKLL